ncbi:MAG TPA: STAS domain-containing protein [Micromonosporaceae bacterium]|jgi:anti-anti-sigma factor
MTVLAIDRSSSDGVAQVALSGDVDLAAAPVIRAKIKALLREDATAGIVVDLSAVRFIDSSGIGLLIGCRRIAADRSKTFRAGAATGQVAVILGRTGVTELLAGR